MIRKAEKRDILAIMELQHQVDMVHYVIRPDLFKPNTTKYNEQEFETPLMMRVNSFLSSMTVKYWVMLSV